MSIKWQYVHLTSAYIGGSQETGMTYKITKDITGEKDKYIVTIGENTIIENKTFNSFIFALKHCAHVEREIT